MSDPLSAELKVLESQLEEISGQLAEVALDMAQGGFSEFPIFVAHREEAKIGELLLDRNEYNFPYSISVSSMEDFEELGILKPDKLDEFRTTYGNSKKQTCIFWIYNTNANFIFFPLAGRKSDNN